MCACVYLLNPSAQGLFFKRSLTGLNSEFSFSWTFHCTEDKEHSLPNYLLIAGE